LECCGQAQPQTLNTKPRAEDPAESFLSCVNSHICGYYAPPHNLLVLPARPICLSPLPPLPLSPMDTKQGALSSRIVASKQKFQAHKQAEGGKEYRTTSLCDFLRLLRNIIMHHTPGV
jgi:hypothetical protein